MKSMWAATGAAGAAALEAGAAAEEAREEQPQKQKCRSSNIISKNRMASK